MTNEAKEILLKGSRKMLIVIIFEAGRFIPIFFYCLIFETIWVQIICHGIVH